MFDWSCLTKQQRVVVILAAWGMTNDQIAKELSIARSTVKNHLYDARRRTKAKNTVHLVALAVKHGHADPEQEPIR
jgi:DNA-binding CsgD family transcriptional regulator